MPWAACRHCGAIFVARFGAVYCPDHRGWRSRLIGPTTLTCVDCGGSWLVEGQGRRDRKRCPDCQWTFTAQRDRLTGTEVARRRGAKARRRLRTQIVERVKGRCGICGETIDLTLPWQDPDSLSLDHIIPIAAGGTDDEANLQPAHRRCNEAKSDRVEEAA